MDSSRCESDSARDSHAEALEEGQFNEDEDDATYSAPVHQFVQSGVLSSPSGVCPAIMEEEEEGDHSRRRTTQKSGSVWEKFWGSL